MRILQICSARDIGGGERHVADLANALVARGHDVCAAVNPNAALISELRSLPKENIFELRMRGAADIVASEKIAAIVRGRNINIIHAHVARDYPLTAMASARSSGTPFVLTRHVLFPLSKLHKLILRDASRVITVSNAVAEAVKRRNIFDPEKVVTIHNGLDVGRFQGIGSSRPDAFRQLKADHLVGVVGNIGGVKGQDIFVRAAAIIARERSDIDFVIVGEDRSRRGENLRAIETLVKELGLTERVHLIGWQSDIPSMLPHLDIYVSASRSESFGLAMLEAMAAGVPVVATATGGASEIIEEGVSGLLVPIGDPDALALAVSNLLDDPSLGRRLAENGLEKVKTSFSLNAMVDATERIYREVLK